MKKIFVHTLFAVLVTGSVFANTGVSVSNKVQESFTREFAGAQGVRWESLSSKSIFHASFVYNNERLNAYFNNEGELIATGRYIKSESLPLLAGRAISNRFPNQTIEEVIEYVTGTETSYIVTVHNARRAVSAQVYLDGTVTVIKKEKKK